MSKMLLIGESVVLQKTYTSSNSRLHSVSHLFVGKQVSLLQQILVRGHSTTGEEKKRINKRINKMNNHICYDKKL